jgi:hypothetical protein
LKKILVVLAAAAVAALSAAASARADAGLLVGFDDHWLLENPTAAVTKAEMLGADGFRVPIYWTYGQTALSKAQIKEWDPAIQAALGMRIVVVVTGASAKRPPLTASARNAYCGFIKSLLARYPTIGDIVEWNEPNKSADWQPQYKNGKSAAPAAYEAMIARCWDVLHAYRDDVNLLAPATSPNGNDNPNAVSNISHSPGNFIAGMGAAYKASGRTLPIFDNVSHHNYGVTPSERPWRQHAGSMIAEGDWAKLVSAFQTAFSGTQQPVPGRCVADRCAKIWYLESGYQTTIAPAKRRFYKFKENVPRLVPPSGPGDSASHPDAASPAPDQATQIEDGIALAYCQPYVAVFFNYLLRDDRDLRGWSSGALWYDGTPKPSFNAFRTAISDAHEGNIDCSSLKGGGLPQPARLRAA